MTHLRTYSLAAVALFGAIAACSPTISDPNNFGSGGSGNQQQFGVGGTVGQTGAGGGPANPSGSGGSAQGTGGAVVGVGTGGTIVGVGTGGATDSGPVCGEPAGTMIAGGYINNGEICGFAWTATNDEGETIVPPCGDGGVCFSGTEICASGTIPANDATTESYTGIMIGINAQQKNDDSAEGTWTASGSLGLKWTAGGATGEPRILIQTSGGDYCVPNAKSGTTYSITEFVKECWEGGKQSPALTAATAVKGIALQINGDDTEQTFDGLCITDIINE